MKVITVNLPVPYVLSMRKLVGEIYPSRSELVRAALKAFLEEEIKKEQQMLPPLPIEEEVDKDLFVRVPVDKVVSQNGITREYKTYKLVKR